MSLLAVRLEPPPDFLFFEIRGEPQSWKRHGGFGKRSFNPSRKNQESIAWQCKAACPHVRLDEVNVFSVRLSFFHLSPISMRRDLDNCTKEVFDSLQGVVWKNDVQVRELYAIAIPDRRPRTEVLIQKIDHEYLAKRGQRAYNQTEARR